MAPFLCTCFIFLLFTFGYHLPYLSGELLYYHDSIIAMTHMHLFYDAFFLGELPLWDPYTNGGQPLWPVVEVSPSLDPIAFVMWGIAYLSDLPGNLAYQWTCFVWLFLFAWGGSRCTRFLVRDAWSPVVVFLVLFAGPLAISMTSQSHGFLIPFRYVPFVLYSFLCFESKPSLSRIILLGIVTAFSAAGYQSVYALFLIAVFILSYWFFCGASGTWKQYGTGLGVYLLGVLPTIVAGLEMMRLYPVLRDYPGYGYFFNLSEAVQGYFFRGLSFLKNDSGWRLANPHGAVYIGTIPGALSLLGAFLVFFFWRKHRNKEATFQPVAKVWAVSLCVALFFCFGGIQWVLPNFKTFLGLRNWGFIFPFVLLGVSQLLALALAWLSTLISKYWKIRSLSPQAVIVLLVLTLSIPDLYRLARRNQWHLLGDRQDNLYALQRAKPFPAKRQWQLDIERQYPYIYHGSLLARKPIARAHMPNELTYKKGVLPFTHTFQLPQYQSLLSQETPRGALKESLGVKSDLFQFENGGGPTLNRYALEKFQSHRVQLNVEMKQAGPFVYMDSLSRHWKVFVNGLEKRLSPFKALSKGVVLPEGRHAVEFRYEPTPYVLSFWIRCIFSLLGIAYLFTYLIRAPKVLLSF